MDEIYKIKQFFIKEIKKTDFNLNMEENNKYNMLSSVFFEMIYLHEKNIKTYSLFELNNNIITFEIFTTNSYEYVKINLNKIYRKEKIMKIIL